MKTTSAGDQHTDFGGAVWTYDVPIFCGDTDREALQLLASDAEVPNTLDFQGTIKQSQMRERRLVHADDIVHKAFRDDQRLRDLQSN